MSNFDKVRDYLSQLNLSVETVDAEAELVIVNDQESGIVNLVIDCEEPILVLEQHILDLSPETTVEDCRRLLQLNRELVHGAYCLDEEGKRLFFRDTLQLGTLDIDELDASIDSLRLAMAEHVELLLSIAQGRKA